MEAIRLSFGRYWVNDGTPYVDESVVKKEPNANKT